MEFGKPLQVFVAHAFFAAIMGMGLQGKLSFSQPAAERFGIDAQTMTGIGDREKDHQVTPFRSG
jgi:hypothetical protein